MPARTAYPMIYRLITTDLPEDKHLEVDVILGSKVARERQKELRRRTIDTAGFEVG